MRHDGRKAYELRSIEIIPHFPKYADGSVLISFGSTRMLCNLTIANSVPSWMLAGGKPGGWVIAEYALLPRSTLNRMPRETGGIGARTQEIRRLIYRSLRAAIDLEKLGVNLWKFKLQPKSKPSIKVDWRR